MTDTKPWWQSKGVWGGLVAAAAGLAGLLGFHIPEGEIQTLTDAVLSGVTAVAGAFAVYGRVVAGSKID